MLKLFTLLLIFFIASTLHAQWTSNPPYLWTNSKVGIGVTTPQTEFELGSSTNPILRFSRTSTTTPAGTLVGVLQGMNSGVNGELSSIRFMSETTYSSGAYGTQMQFWTREDYQPVQQRMVITKSGKVGIGITNPGNYTLNVNGPVRATQIVVNTTGADFVFEDDYKLTELNELEKYINANKHLPAIPSAAEVEKNGVEIGNFQSKLLQKVEELTLYLIKLNKENEQLKKEIENIKTIIR